MDTLLVLPFILPLLTAILCVFAWRWTSLQRAISLIGALGMLTVSGVLLTVVANRGIMVTEMGAWPAPFGIVFVADLTSALLLVLPGLIAVMVNIYSLTNIDSRRASYGFYPVINVMFMGINAAFLTGDIFNLYVCFEILLIASFVLLALGGERAQMEGAVKYITLNLMSSTFFLTAVGVLYGLTGALNMADLSVKLQESHHPSLVSAVSLLFFMAFGIKAAVFPMFFWLPASYHTPPVAVSAAFAALLTKVGIYSLIRVFTLLFTLEVEFTHNLLLIVAGVTMVTGVLGAASQMDFRRILGFHSVSQVGYMLMGLALYSKMALAGAILFILHHAVVKSNLFLVSGIVSRLRGTDQLKKLGGLYKSSPVLALIFLASALSLAGLPPFSGFFGKLALIRAGVELDQYLIVIVSLMVSVMTFFSMTKIWGEVFWKDAPETAEEPRALVAPQAFPVEASLKESVSDNGGDEGDQGHSGEDNTDSDSSWGDETLRNIPWSMLGPALFMALLTTAMGIFAGPLFDLCLQAAEQLMNPEIYIQAVLGGKR